MFFLLEGGCSKLHNFGIYLSVFAPSTYLLHSKLGFADCRKLTADLLLQAYQKREVWEDGTFPSNHTRDLPQLPATKTIYCLIHEYLFSA